MNQFKKLCHLNLKFRASTDENLKKYLSNKFSKERQENEEIRIKNQRLEENLQQKCNEIEECYMQNNKMKEEKEKIIENLIIEEKKKFNLYQEKIIEKETALIKENENYKNNMTEKYEKKINDLQNKNDILSQNNQELNEIK